MNKIVILLLNLLQILLKRYNNIIVALIAL